MHSGLADVRAMRRVIARRTVECRAERPDRIVPSKAIRQSRASLPPRSQARASSLRRLHGTASCPAIRRDPCDESGVCFGCESEESNPANPACCARSLTALRSECNRLRRLHSARGGRRSLCAASRSFAHTTPSVSAATRGALIDPGRRHNPKRLPRSSSNHDHRSLPCDGDPLRSPRSSAIRCGGGGPCVDAASLPPIHAGSWP